LLVWLRAYYFVLFFVVYIAFTVALNLAWRSGWRGIAPPQVFSDD
jgi:CDP-diacylglycerol--serine O-phosphatidyltransferase